MSSMKVCVFGATGFVGTAITNELERRGIQWVGVSRTETPNPKIISAPISANSQIEKIISDYSVVINAMGSFKPDNFEANPKGVFQNFWDNTQAFCELLISCKVTQLLHISSGGTVYGENIGKASEESDRLRPISWYGKAKAIEESMFEKVALQKGFKYICARVSNPFGNSRFTTHGFIDVLINSVRNHGIFTTFSDPAYCRDFIHCEDMASVLISLLTNHATKDIETYNVGSGKSIPLLDVLASAKSFSPKFEYKLERLSTDYDVVQNILNINKLKLSGIDPEGFTTVDEYLFKKLRDSRSNV